MTIRGIFSRLCRVRDSIRIAYYTDTMLKGLLQTTIFPEIRVKIWRRLGNKIGEDSFINSNIVLVDDRRLGINVILGDRVALAPYITFITYSAPNNSRLGIREDTVRFLRKGTITIGDDTWIGANTVIHPGVTIGKNCIIGACSNVTTDIPDNTVAYGNPARIIKAIKHDM